MRSGVLSDLAIKSAYPEYEPLNMGLAQASDSVIFHRHELVGVRLPKNYNPKKIPRFPVNDLNNFSTLSSNPNKSKQVYSSIQGYRKKLGSSNIDTEMRQTGRKLMTATNEPVAYMSNNYEIRMKGGVADKINKSNIVSQADIYANVKRVPHDGIMEVNKINRNDGARMANIEKRINMENLENITKATKTAHENIDRARQTFLDKAYNSTQGGELYYNYLTTQDYYDRRNPLKHAEGYSSKSIPMVYNVDLRTMEDMTGKDPDEFITTDPNTGYVRNATNVSIEGLRKDSAFLRQQITSIPFPVNVDELPEPKTAFNATEEYSYVKERPFKDAKNEKRMAEADVKTMEAQMIEPDEVVLPMSEASRKDPKTIPDNLVDFIRQREQAKMQNPNYQAQTDKYLINKSALTQQKRIDRIELTPTDYKEKYGMSVEEKKMEKARYTDKSESSTLGAQLRQKRADVIPTYAKYGIEKLAPAHTAKLSMASSASSNYIQERNDLYQERLEYDAFHNEAFGGDPFNF